MATISMMLIIMSFAVATPIITLNEFGMESFEIQGINEKKCTQINFYFEKIDEIKSDSNLVAQMLLKAEFENTNGLAEIEIILNNSVKKIKEREMNCDEDGCYKTIYLNKETINEINTLKLCGKTGNQESKIILRENSKIGFEKTPRFLEQEFTKTPEKNNILLGEDLEMTIYITNSGSKDADVYISHIAKEVEQVVDITTFNVVIGDSETTTTIKAGETKEIKYTIKPNQPSNYILPSATLNFQNIEGKTEQIRTEHPEIKVDAPDMNFFTFYLKNQEKYFTNEDIEFQLAIKNQSLITQTNVMVELVVSDLFNIQQKKYLIDEIKPNEIKYLKFEAIKPELGQYVIKCNMTTETGISESCSDTKFIIHNSVLTIESIAGIILAIFALGIYVFIVYFER